MPTPAYDTPTFTDDIVIPAADAPTTAAEIPILAAEMPTTVANILIDDDPEKPNHMIIWLDKTIGNPKEYIHLKKAFGSNTDPRVEVPTMLTDEDYDEMLVAGDAVTVTFEGVVFLLQAFTDEDACLAAFEKNQHRRIFFITSGSMGSEAVPKIIEKYRPIFTDPITDKAYASVYVFCHNIELQMGWGMEYLDYVQMFNFDSELLERMTRDIAGYFIMRSERILEDNDPKGALQRLHWAKRLWEQYDKMQQKIDIDNRRPVIESQGMKDINKKIEEIEENFPTESSDDEDRNNDDHTNTNNFVYQNTNDDDDVNINQGVNENTNDDNDVNINNDVNENPNRDDSDDDNNTAHEATS